MAPLTSTIKENTAPYAGRRPYWHTFLLVFLVLSTTPVAGESPPQFQDIKQIVDRGKIVVAVVDKNFPPLFFHNDSGKLRGFDIDLATGIANRLDVEVEFNPARDTFDAAIELVALGEADVAISWISRTLERAERVLFTRPYSEQSQMVIVNRVKGVKFRRRCPKVEEVVEAAEQPGRFGAVKGSAFAQMATIIGKGNKPVEEENFEDLLRSAYEGDILMAYHGELQTRTFLKQNKAYAVVLKACAIKWPTDKIAIAVRPDAPNLLRYLNIYLETCQVFVTPSELVDMPRERYDRKLGTWLFCTESVANP